MAITISDVAKYAGVGVGTVSRVINDDKSVNDDTRERVKHAIETLQYRPNRMASRLRRNETKILALMVPIIDHPFFAKLAYYVDDEADKYGYSILLVSSQQRVWKEKDIIERIKHREVDGAVFVTHYAHDEADLRNCPIVSLDRRFGADIPYVTSNNYEATARAIEYLMKRGCRRIGYIGSRPIVASEVMERERAYVETLAAHGMETYLVDELIQHGDEGEVASAFLDRYPDLDGVFASGYSMAQAFYSKAIARGIDIPGQMQLIAYDGAFSQWNWQEGRIITCVEQPIEQMGRALVRMLLAKIHGEPTEERVVFDTRFLIGSTTR